MILLPNVIYRLIFCPFLSVSQQVRSWSWGLRSDALVMATVTVLFPNSCPSGEEWRDRDRRAERRVAFGRFPRTL